MLRIVIGAAALALLGNAAPQAQTEPPFRVLITNDDGVSSEGIAALVAAFRPIADVVVAAPAENNSGGSQSVTLFSKPLQVDRRDAANAVPHYAVHGTPADSVVFGLLGPGKERPFDMVVSGVNKGENVGDAVHVSGTVGAARQAVMMGVPAIAVSQQYLRDGKYDFTVAARFTAQLAQALHRLGDKAPRFVSVNVPTVAKGVRLVPTGGSTFKMNGLKTIGEKGPGSTLYGIDFLPGGTGQPGADSGELMAGYITVTALSTNANDSAATKSLGTIVPALPNR